MVMSERSNHMHSRDQDQQEKSVFEPPTYQISWGIDNALQWHPPADSEELAIALSYHFPFEKTLFHKMQAAMEKFLRAAGRCYSGNGKLPKKEKQENNTIPTRLESDSKRGLCMSSIEGRCLAEDHAGMYNSPCGCRKRSPPSQNRQQPGTTSSALTNIPGLLSFDVNTLKEVKIKRRKRAYEGAERTEVGANRGKVCEFHRRQKIKVCLFSIYTCYIY